MEMLNQVDPEVLREMQSMNEDELFAKAEQLQAEDINACDFSNTWDILHYLFTGVSASEPIEADALSEAVVGTEMFIDDSDYYIAYIYPERVKEIALALGEFDFSEAVQKFSPVDVLERELYPYFWHWNESDSAQMLIGEFEDIKGFYEFAAENDRAVVVTIIY